MDGRYRRWFSTLVKPPMRKPFGKLLVATIATIIRLQLYIVTSCSCLFIKLRFESIHEIPLRHNKIQRHYGTRKPGCTGDRQK